MNDANQVRINELARELEVKAKAIIDLLPGYGVTEKKTHSSSIPVDVAEKVRKKLAGGDDEEAAPPAKEVAREAAPSSPAPAPSQLRPAVPVAAPPVAPRPLATSLPVAQSPAAPATSPGGGPSTGGAVSPGIAPAGHSTVTPPRPTALPSPSAGADGGSSPLSAASAPAPA